MDIDALAALAANTLVATAVTDTFEQFCTKIARLFGRDNPDPATGRRLDSTRRQLAEASGEGLEGARAVQARQWATRFADLLADHPEAVEELQALLAEFGKASGSAGGNIANSISGTVHGPVLMGRDFGDITIGDRDNLPSAEAEPPRIAPEPGQLFGMRCRKGGLSAPLHHQPPPERTVGTSGRALPHAQARAAKTVFNGRSNR